MAHKYRRAQSMAALEVANKVRIDRAALRRQVKAGEIDPLTLLWDPPTCIEKIPIHDFLMWIPWVGRRKARHFTRGFLVTADPPLGVIALKTRQRIYFRVAEWRQTGTRQGHLLKVGQGDLKVQYEVAAA